MGVSRTILALGSLLLTAAAAEAGVDPATSAQRDFLLRHYFQGPSETSGWARSAARNPTADDGRMLGPFRPAYYDLKGERRRGDRTTAQLAALDLHVKPGRSVVHVAGQAVGQARRYDGIPRWLWLEPGPQVLTFVTPEGDTIRKTFELGAGSVTNLEVVLD